MVLRVSNFLVLLSELIVHRVALKRIKLMGSIDVLVHDFIILLLKLF